MFEQLQSALAKYEEQEDLIAQLQTRNLALLAERDEYKGKAEANEKFERQASQAIALANKVNRLAFNVEDLAGKLTVSNKERDKAIADYQAMMAGENPKRLKESNKRLKLKNKELTDAVACLKKENKAYSDEARKLRKEDSAKVAELKEQLGMANDKMFRLGLTFREFGDYQVMLWPSVMGVDRGGNGVERLMALLVMTPFGNGTLLTVKDGLLMTPEHFRPCIEAHGDLPDEIKEFAETWLGKLERQDYHFTDADILAFREI